MSNRSRVLISIAIVEQRDGPLSIAVVVTTASLLRWILGWLHDHAQHHTQLGSTDFLTISAAMKEPASSSPRDIIQEIRTHAPWWMRVAAKLVLARLPISYRVWSRFSLFKHGEMDRPQ